MIIHSNKILSAYLTADIGQTLQVIPEQLIAEDVQIAKEAIPFIRCELESTIQHESGHRKDEETRYDQPGPALPFDQLTDPSRSEQIAKREEKNCDALLPPEYSGETVTVSLSQLFEDAKTSANVDPAYRKDIRAGTLDPRAEGMYIVQDLPDPVAVRATNTQNRYEGFDGSLWIDVRKIVNPFIVLDNQQQQQHQPDYQDDGIVEDVPGVSQIPPTDTAVPATPGRPAVPARGAL